MTSKCQSWLKVVYRFVGGVANATIDAFCGFWKISLGFEISINIFGCTSVVSLMYVKMNEDVNGIKVFVTESEREMKDGVYTTPVF